MDKVQGMCSQVSPLVRERIVLNGKKVLVQMVSAPQMTKDFQFMMSSYCFSFRVCFLSHFSSQTNPKAGSRAWIQQWGMSIGPEHHLRRFLEFLEPLPSLPGVM